ncbi:MAG: hypothetical protein LJE62_00185 [Silicimonas sp.]|nr:hypothetical protein [Silicimonas sp.]
MRRLLIPMLSLLGLAACAPQGGLMVSEQARSLGGNLFVEKSLDGNTFLVLDGPITTDTTFVFLALIEDVEVKGLVIAQSPGGDLLAAHQIGRAIKRARMNTMVLDACLSACVDVFVAGRQREVFDTTVLGLHSPTIGGWRALLPSQDRDAPLRATYLIDRGYWRDMGFPQVNEAAYSIPNSRIWMVNAKRARELRLATNVIRSSGRAGSIAPPG